MFKKIKNVDIVEQPTQLKSNVTVKVNFIAYDIASTLVIIYYYGLKYLILMQFMIIDNQRLIGLNKSKYITEKN